MGVHCVQGHLRLILLPIVYNAMAQRENLRSLPLFRALQRAMRASSYDPLLRHPPAEPAKPPTQPTCAHPAPPHERNIRSVSDAWHNPSAPPAPPHQRNLCRVYDGWCNASCSAYLGIKTAPADWVDSHKLVLLPCETLNVTCHVQSCLQS